MPSRDRSTGQTWGRSTVHPGPSGQNRWPLRPPGPWPRAGWSVCRATRSRNLRRRRGQRLRARCLRAMRCRRSKRWDGAAARTAHLPANRARRYLARSRRGRSARLRPNLRRNPPRDHATGRAAVRRVRPRARHSRRPLRQSGRRSPRRDLKTGCASARPAVTPSPPPPALRGCAVRTEAPRGAEATIRPPQRRGRPRR